MNQINEFWFSYATQISWHEVHQVMQKNYAIQNKNWQQWSSQYIMITDHIVYMEHK